MISHVCQLHHNVSCPPEGLDEKTVVLVHRSVHRVDRFLSCNRQRNDVSRAESKVALGVGVLLHCLCGIIQVETINIAAAEQARPDNIGDVGVHGALNGGGGGDDDSDDGDDDDGDDGGDDDVTMMVEMVKIVTIIII